MCMISVFSGTPSKTVRSSRAFLSHALYPTRDMQKARHHMGDALFHYQPRASSARTS